MACSPCAVCRVYYASFVFQSGGPHIETHHPDWDTQVWHFQRTGGVRTVLEILTKQKNWENMQRGDSKGFLRRCRTLRITGFLFFAHRPIFDKLGKTTFRKQDLFPSSGERRKIPTLYTGRPVIEVSSF
jgi:hypothetical protein